MRYSLADYYLSIASDNAEVTALFKDVRIGGEGDALSSISIERTDNLWSTESYATGAWVHNKNLSKVGNISVSVSQLTDAVAKFKTFVEYFYRATEDGADVGGVTITLTSSDGEVIATCEDCYPVKIPAQEFGATAANQTWQFTSGRVNIR